MKNILSTIIISVFFLTCKNKEEITSKPQVVQNDLNTITEIVFTETNVSIPTNFELHKIEFISMKKDSSYLIHRTYKKGILVNEQIINSIKNNNNPFASIPDEYLNKSNLDIGDVNSLVESVFIADVELINKKISWNISYNLNTISDEIKPFISSYYLTKNKLYKN